MTNTNEDPLGALRALDGQLVHVKQARPIEDVEGRPLGIEHTDEGPALLCLPDYAALAAWQAARDRKSSDG